MRPFRRWRWPWPQTWGQVYTVLAVWLLASLGLIYLADWLKQVLGRWP